MSAWGEMRRRSAGRLKRKENEFKYITLEQIEDRLKSMKPGSNPDEYSPIYMFKVVVKDFISNECVLYSITAMATEHQDGTKDFYTEGLINSFKNLMEKIGDIVEIE